MPSLETTIGTITTKNPFWAGSGSMTQELNANLGWIDSGYGAIVPKTVAPDGCECVDPPHAWVSPSSSIGKAYGVTGWNCEGISRLPLAKNVEIIRTLKERRPQAVIVGSVLAMAESKDSWSDVIAPLLEYCSMFELNVSCPQNVIEKGAGAVIGRDPDLLERVVGWVKEILGPLGFPFSVKLTPMVADVRLLARVAAQAGCDALTCFNTYRGNLGFDPETRVPVGKNSGWGTNGATSGACIHTISLEGVRLVAEELDKCAPEVKIIASGGVHDFRTAMNYMLFGAQAVQIYSALSHELPATLCNAFTASMEKHGDETIESFRGKGREKFLSSSEIVARVGGQGANGAIPPTASSNPQTAPTA